MTKPPSILADPSQPRGNVNQSPRQVRTTFAPTPGVSPWLRLDSPPQIAAPIVRRIPQHIPGRAVSTFSVPSRIQAQRSAAPFPSLPTKMEIQEQTRMIEREIQSACAELSALQHQRKSFDHSGHSLIPTSSGKGIREYHNLIICESILESVWSDNKERQRAATAGPVPPKFRNIQDLPGYWRTLDEHRENVAVIFGAHMTVREMVKEKQENLAESFRIQRKRWLKTCDVVDEYSARVDDKNDDWPPEFPKGKTKSENLAEVTKLTAPDQPMIMTGLRKMNYCYYDMNGEVLDPKAAHDEFRARISWSDEEKRKFVAKYTQHPKKFRLIAESLPLKTVKDVIEFYYVNKYMLSLKDKEAARRKRGGKKKVISEGSAKPAKP